MIDKYYSALKSALTPVQAGLTVAWYCEQYHNWSEEKAAFLPAILVEFGPLTMQQQGGGMQVGTGTVRLHCVTLDRTPSPISVVSLAQAVFKTLNNKALQESDGTAITSALIRSGISLTNRLPNIKCRVDTYTAEWYDYEGVKVADTVTFGGLNQVTQVSK